MTDKHSTTKKHSHGKKNLRAKFTNGFKHIFHHTKPITRSSSVPTELDDPRANHFAGFANFPYPSVSYDIDISNDTEATASRSIPVSTRPSSAMYSFGSAQDIDTISPGKNDISWPFPANHSFRKSFTSLDYFKRPSDLLKAKQKISIYDNISSINNKDIVIANSPGLLGRKETSSPIPIATPDANNNTEQKLKSSSLPSNLSGTPEIPSSSDSVREMDDATERRTENICDGHVDPNKGITNKLANTNTIDVISNGNADSFINVVNTTVTQIGSKSYNSHRLVEPSGPKGNKSVSSNNSSVNPSLQARVENTISGLDKDISDHVTSTPRPNMTRSLTEDTGKDRTPKAIPRSFSENLRHMHTMGYTIEKEKLQTVVADVIQLHLGDKIYDAKLVTRWCKEICVKVRDRLLRVKELRHKIVVNAHLASKLPDGSNVDTIFVATRCQKDVLNDRFITVALEGKDMYIWVTVLLVKHR